MKTQSDSKTQEARKSGSASSLNLSHLLENPYAGISAKRLEELNQQVPDILAMKERFKGKDKNPFKK